MNGIKTTWIVASLALAAVLFSDPALASGPVPAYSSGVHPLTVVDIASETRPAMLIAAQACAGLYNRKFGGSVYTRMSSRIKYFNFPADKDSKWMEELGLKPDQIMDADRFLDACVAEFPRTVRYSYEGQRRLLPNILTVGAVLDAIPLDEKMEVKGGKVVFDATVEFKERNTPYLATNYVYENFVNDTTGLAMLNPGYDITDKKVWDPAINKEMNTVMVDLVFAKKLFVIFLINGCIDGAREHALLNQIVSRNPWPKPIGVYGYADYWLVFGGFLFESQTMCSDARNMGEIATTVNNLSFFSTRREPIIDPGELKRNELENIEYDPAKTYVAFIVGDGDNIEFIMDSRAEWLRQRVQACQADEKSCLPLTWSISPHLLSIAPDVLEWYYDMSHQTGKDYFMLPPCGHLYAYPSSLGGSIQDLFVAATENDARLLGTHSTVHWEWFSDWRHAEREFLPKYAHPDGPIQGLFAVNVPYLFSTGTWRRNQFFKALAGRDGARVVLFRPRPWRGVNDRGERGDRKYYLSPGNMAKELGEYPRGTVAAIYMTSDGGLTLENSFMALTKILPEHVRLVSSDTAVRLALEASETMKDK
jgi:hypothetical protein